MVVKTILFKKKEEPLDIYLFARKERYEESIKVPGNVGYWHQYEKIGEVDLPDVLAGVLIKYPGHTREDLENLLQTYKSSIEHLLALIKQE